MKTGNTRRRGLTGREPRLASMEPGHEDREYIGGHSHHPLLLWPQWSPAMKTGNTAEPVHQVPDEALASMEPGHEDREYRHPLWTHPSIQ